ncbi:hypothetical protein PR048_023826 [Dryococelus australis]|uniref:Uncharacterized protein n=1 Tax=Dryococelus australis TaxID=614101 RepID=A0ABQ9GV89_9NEOP|nr:hypothetical protein PR048_023826 [Dryococelus australis]
MDSRDEQRRYLASLLEFHMKSRTRTKNKSKSRRTITVHYNIQTSTSRVGVRKQCFLTAFGESRGFVNGIKNASANGIILGDQRGRHPQAIKRSEGDIALVRRHILGFPAYESHYSRQRSSKLCLGSDLNLEKMYELYKQKLDSKKPCNIKFKNLHVDICKTYDSFNVKTKATQNNCNCHYECKRRDKEMAANAEGKILVAVCDLHQCLPTPDLTSSISFYKRKLWTFNLAVQGCTTGENLCYMWNCYKERKP